MKTISVKLIQEMIDYIQSKPYREVAHIMDRLKKELQEATKDED